MEFDSKGHLLVSRPNSADIQTYRYEKGTAKLLGTFVKDRRSVHGLFRYEDWMYYTTTDSVRRARDESGDGVADVDEVVLAPEKLGSEGGGHWWRSILVTKDSIYTGIGDSGNITDEPTRMRQKIMQFDRAGKGRVFVSGIRNTEKLRLRPGTNEIWGMDHGSDNWGGPLGETAGKNQPLTDLNPPDEFNRYVDGGFYGHPFVVGNRVPRYEYASRKDIVEIAARTTPPEWCFGAHWAMNGFTFLERDTLGLGSKGDAVCAAHGSWNSSQKVGYRIERVLFDSVTGRPYGSLALVSTLGPNGQVLGRPVDCVEAPDGSILFSDDQGGAIYRIEVIK